MIDVSELMEDPDFASPYLVVRRDGEWINGRFVPGEPETLKFYGPVQPPSVRELEQLPEGDRQKGFMQFWCKMPREFRISQGSKKESWVSDEIIWRGQRFKLYQLMPWNHAGWMSALAYRTGGAYGAAEPGAGTD